MTPIFDLTRFFARVRFVSATGCWMWQGATGGAGAHLYGVYAGTTAHRAAYLHFRGPVPVGKVLDHVVCDTKLCANPWHVEPRTQQQNLGRSPATLNAQNAARSHCDNGHLLSGENVRMYRNQRVCRACKREWMAKKRAAQ